MAAPVRLLATAGILAGGLFVMKAMDLAVGLPDAWAAWAEDNPAPHQQAEHPEDTAEPYLPNLAQAEQGADANCPAVSNDVFAERVGASPSELEVLRALSERRRLQDARADELDTREALLEAAEQRVDGRIAELRELRDEIESLIGSLSEAEEAEMERIVAFYRGMDPADAAERIAALAPDTQVQIAARMPARNFSAILGEMPVPQAAQLTMRIAARNDLPDTVAELETRLGEEG
ncbi:MULTISPECIES: MotE family protein [Hyphobacterium]|uniref:MotE family protein n=1 Tax=Hyphobacterium vulgare TaxID=1736751 RepID=A0ABV7A0G4_9PROT